MEMISKYFVPNKAALATAGVGAWTCALGLTLLVSEMFAQKPEPAGNTDKKSWQQTNHKLTIGTIRGHLNRD